MTGTKSRLPIRIESDPLSAGIPKATRGNSAIARRLSGNLRKARKKLPETGSGKTGPGYFKDLDKNSRGNQRTRRKNHYSALY